MKGSELVTRREVLGLNQSQAAEFLGIDRTTLIRWEKADDLPRLAAAGAATLLKPGADVNDWVMSQKPAARRAVYGRIAENVTKAVEESKTVIATGPGPAILRAGLSGQVLNELAEKSQIELAKLVGFSAGGDITVFEEGALFRAELELGWITLAAIPEGGNYRPGQMFHVTEIASFDPVNIPSDGTLEKAAAEFKEAVLEQAIAARGAARPDSPAPDAEPGFKRGGPDPVAEFRRDAAPLPISDWPVDCDACAMKAAHDRNEWPIGAAECAGCPNYKPVVDEFASGPAVEKCRHTLKTLLAQFGGKGVKQLSGKTGILPEDILRFVKEDGSITTSQFAAIMDVLRETEGAP